MLKFTDYNIVFQEIPNEVTLALNISGCPNRCVGCHSPWLMDDIGTPLTDYNLHEIVDRYHMGVTCLCFMGGDANPEEVQKLSLYIKRCFPSIKTAWYSGKEELPIGIQSNSFDFIKLGPYIAKLGPLFTPNTNQHLYRISHPDGTCILFEK